MTLTDPASCAAELAEGRAAGADKLTHTSTSPRISHLASSAVEIQPPGIRVQTRIYFLLPLFGAGFFFFFSP